MVLLIEYTGLTMSKTKAWIILSLFGAFLGWGLVVGIVKFGIIKVGSDIAVHLFFFLLAMAGLFAFGLAILFAKDRLDRIYRRWLRPHPWTKPFVVSQLREAELYDALKSRLEMIERNDEARSETYRDRKTGQKWRKQYVEQGFGNWYELHPD